ncbi:arginine repressor [Faecalibacter rhinopitheci]|uniref:Arginine repressor n=1 Tax=Faecalibacter rhinopitheci TaxID=2779678 RepID=A0A8J7K538_9FLAO|nr:ArgR family transcriptional regulator [Faecalibacter rhinopitheci]MBF0598133.1 ArgR family transcriptional regulator [Faecalibacter rhinopitheci]MBQ0148122.1 ArgR family transcriptional regulator [Candidatus Onthonaster equi]
MSNKKYRFQIIKELITTEEISSQDELLKKLMDLEINVTQATLSRDLRELKVSKLPNTNGNYIYKLTETEPTHQTITHTNQVTLNFSNNLGVIKTKPGYATSLAFEIDNSNFKSIIGTIAGDDTLLIIMKEESTRDEVIKDLKTIVPNINK